MLWPWECDIPARVCTAWLVLGPGEPPEARGPGEGDTSIRSSSGLAPMSTSVGSSSVSMFSGVANGRLLAADG